ncbi:hypothetical protein OAU99_02420 [Candidatus Poseidoniaceae archaeon]|jgi:hypothetical protein|nr:hypothetical protein [Candidatus Poseidoniaceae archaeon]
MVEVGVIEVLAQSMCFISLTAFIFIATFSRSEKLELMAQNFIMVSLLTTAGILWLLSLWGGELWGSNYLPKPLSLLCVIIAIAAKLNIKGQNVSFGANPHSIGKENYESENPNPAEQSTSSENKESNTVINIQNISISDSVVTETIFSNSPEED